VTKVIVGNHTAARVRGSERERIREFYRDVVGAEITRTLDDKDDVRIGEDFYIGFIYSSGSDQGPDQGATYGAEEALSDDDFLKAIFLELKTDDVDAMREKIVASGVRVLEVPDEHLYFQAPGGQVWRLVGIDEDLSIYEGS
jgi:catechol 2,3-dioxygenase-like lactoylglutathione lyase family enzyme